MSGPREYSAFGLRFLSERTLSELPLASSAGERPVRLHWLDELDELPPNPGARGLFSAAHGALTLTVPGVAQYRVERDEITIVALRTGSADAVRLFLLGSAVGALLHLNGILALHGSAVRMRSGEVAVFTGASTAGKSTLLAGLTERGLAPLCDDVVAIQFDDAGQAWVQPGLSRMKLWHDTLAMLGRSHEDAVRVRPELDKYAIAISPHSEPARLGRVYELVAVETGEVALSEVTGMEKLRLLDRQTFRPAFVEALGLRSEHLLRLGKLAPRVGTSQIVRPRDRNTLQEIIVRLERDWL